MNINYFNQNCEKGLLEIESESVDVVLTDPPYQYLKHKLDIPFNEDIVFAQFKRILKKNGFVIMFGRGESFYRWNYILSTLGFKFKEEIIWNKTRPSSALLPMSRVHETVSIYSKDNGKIKRTKVSYLESKKYDVDSVIGDIKRLKNVFKNKTSFDAVMRFLETNKRNEDDVHKPNYTTISSYITKGNVCASIVHSITKGMNEKSIIQENRDLPIVHPTQKPVNLLIRLLNLVSEPGCVVCDPFAGSCSTGVACKKTGRHFIGFELDYDYYTNGKKRLDEECEVIF